MTEDLNKHLTLVTGASSGIGRECAIRLSKNRRLLLHGRNLTQLEQTKELCSNSERHAIWTMDLNEISAIATSLGSVVQNPEKQVECFVHCAGTLTVQPLRTTTLEASARMINVNFLSAVEITRLLVSQRVNGKALSSIVFVSSTASQFGAKGFSIYSATKGALDSMMRSLAVELAPRVRVNSVLPGAIPTAMTACMFADEALRERMRSQYPLGLGKPEDAAAVVEFLSSDDAKWITGQQFVVDGGRTINISA
jgi:NAD(P)-dependent dehydrogenase (short-subunit alcohol dehydrogenase family)